MKNRYKILILFLLNLVMACSFASNPPRVGVPPVLIINATDYAFIPAYFNLDFKKPGEYSYSCIFGYFPANDNIRISLDECPVGVSGKWPDNDQIPHVAALYMTSYRAGYFQGEMHYDPKTRHWSVQKTVGTIEIKPVGGDAFVVTQN